jgi:hypothetical protein
MAKERPAGVIVTQTTKPDRLLLTHFSRHSPDGAGPSGILTRSGSLGKLEPPSSPKNRPRVWCRFHPALKNGDLSVIWTHVSYEFVSNA